MTREIPGFYESAAEMYEDAYVTDVVLKDGPFGRTERVIDIDGELYIRKYLSRERYNPIEWEWAESFEYHPFPQQVARYETDEHYVLIMEYVRGVTLSQFIEAAGSLDEVRALEIFDQLCEAIRHLHIHGEAPIIHRDIKPDNIIVSGGRVRVIDLGTARFRKESASRDTQYVGTIGYAAPEQFGFGQTDERTDVYALGMVLLFMLTGVAPSREQRGSLDGRGDISEKTKAAVSRCVQFDPAARFESVEALMRALPFPEEVEDLSQVASLEEVPLGISVESPVAPSGVAAAPGAGPGTVQQPKGRSAGFWIATILVLLTSLFVLVDPFISNGGFGGRELLLLMVEDYSMLFLIIIPFYVLLANPFYLLDRTRLFATRRTIKKVMILVVCFFIGASLLSWAVNAHSEAYKVWKATQSTSNSTIKN